MSKDKSKKLREESGTDKNNKAFATQAISQRNSTGSGNIAKPDDENVTRARNWVDHHKL